MQFLDSATKEMFHSLSQDDWNEINKRLSYFFFMNYKHEYRLDREDLIQRAILDVYEGRRTCPSGIKLVTVLLGAMRSNASHILERKNKHCLQSIEETSELALFKKENPAKYIELCDELRYLVRGDQFLSRMVELLIHDPKMAPRDMLSFMPDTSEKALRNAKRRLDKLIRKLEKERENE